MQIDQLEVIDYVDGNPSPGLLRLQAVQRSMLADLMAYADELGVRCFLVAGSALGAVRHGDTIPWDDDLDVGMIRSEYERLIAEWSSKRMPDYVLQSEFCDDRYRLPFAKVRLRGTSYQDEHFNEFGLHSGIFIDIFPFDSISRNERLNDAKAMLLFVFDLILQSNSPGLRAFSTHRTVRVLRGVFGAIDRILPVRWLKRVRARILMWPGEQREMQLCCYGMYGPLKYRKTLTSTSELFPLVQGQFGNIHAFLPCKAADILARVFGDYMRLPPIEQRKPFHTSRVSFRT